VQDKITIEFARRLVAQHGSNTDVPDNYHGFTSPLHLLTVQAYDDERPWSDVALLLNHLPPRMAKDAIMRQAGGFKYVPLHYAAMNAPRSVIDRMLALAPDAARVKSLEGWLPLHYAARSNEDVDVIEPLMNAYPNALLETNEDGDTPIDFAINNGRSDEFLKKMFLEAIKLSCSNKFLNYGTLLDDESLYNNSINPINLILIEANHGKRSADDVVEFIDQLNQKPTMFRSLLAHAKKDDTESSPAARACKLDFRTKDARTRVVNALSGDNKEGFVQHNASVGLDDSPETPDRLGRRALAKAVVKVLKAIEDPYSSFTCSISGRWGSGKTKISDMIVEEMMRNNFTTEEKFTPSLPFIKVCSLVKKIVYDMCFCPCPSGPIGSNNNPPDIEAGDRAVESEPLLAPSGEDVGVNRSETNDDGHNILLFSLESCCNLIVLQLSLIISYGYKWCSYGKTLI